MDGVVFSTLSPIPTPDTYHKFSNNHDYFKAYSIDRDINALLVDGLFVFFSSLVTTTLL